MNKAIIIGNLTRQPEAHTTQTGISFCNFTVAVQRDRKNQNGTYDADFIPVVAWRQTADYVTRYLTKGSRVAVCGSIQTRTYDAQDGSKRHVTEIIAETVQGLDRRGTDAPAQQPAQPAQQQGADDFTEVDSSDLPF